MIKEVEDIVSSVKPVANLPPDRSKVEKYRQGRGWELLKRYRVVPKRYGDAWLSKRKELDGKLGSGFCVALIGPHGRGKTQMGNDLMLCCADLFRRSEYTTLTHMLSEIKSSYHHKSEFSENEIVGSFLQPSLLVLDEFEKRAESDWENRLVFEIVNSRYGMMRDTLILSNLRETEFGLVIGQSLASRMLETGGIIDCTWDSFRK